MYMQYVKHLYIAHNFNFIPRPKKTSYINDMYPYDMPLLICRKQGRDKVDHGCLIRMEP